MAQVLHEDHDAVGSHRTVHISGSYGSEITDLRAKMSDTSCALLRFREDAQPTRFSMSAEEMDTLVEQWQALKVARTDWLESEKQRELDALGEAQALAAQHSFQIKEWGHLYLPCWEGGAQFTNGYVGAVQLLECIREMAAEIH